jgi:hypothetical protein
MKCIKDNTHTISNMLTQNEKKFSIDLCVAVARELRQQECYPKDENYDKPLGNVVIDLDKIRDWVRGLDRELANQIFSDQVVLRGVFAYERWYDELCKFLR